MHRHTESVADYDYGFPPLEPTVLSRSYVVARYASIRMTNRGEDSRGILDCTIYLGVETERQNDCWYVLRSLIAPSTLGRLLHLWWNP
jgi:hypothetical protein